MHSPAEDRSRVVAVINALKAGGIRVKNWKNYLNGASLNNDPPKKQNLFAFGRDLSLLPQCDVTDAYGTVPKFLVDACEFLSHHLHTEGLFRKTGSLNRIRALRGGLEQGEPVFSKPYSLTLQPCDVASLLKQFLRELPSPLIPVDLQGPLCLAQSLEEGQEGAKDEATLLITALFPAIHTRALKYLCTFLRQTAERCHENRMEVWNLALVIAPNLLQCPAGASKLTVGTERQLDRQAEVIRVLITNADRIGVIPPSILSMSPLSECGESTPPCDGGKFQQRGMGVYRSLKRQRRRSVGEIFVDALSKLKTGFTPTGTSNPGDSQQNARSATPQSPITIKRKSTEDPIPDVEGSAKKRRSILDLRDDAKLVNNQPSDDHKASVGHSCNLSNVLSAVDVSREQKACVTVRASQKKHPKKDKKLNRPQMEEDNAQRKRPSLFFNPSRNDLNVAGSPFRDDNENLMAGSETLCDDLAKVFVAEKDDPTAIPLILVDRPGGGVMENEVENDPELLSYSFIEDPSEPLDTPGSPTDMERVKHQKERSSVMLEHEAINGLVNPSDVDSEWCGQVKTGVKPHAKEVDPDKEWVGVEEKVQVEPHKKPRPPRRSISMPDVILDHMRGPDETQGEDYAERSFLITTHDDETPQDVCPERANPNERPQLDRILISVDTGVGKGRKEGAGSKQEGVTEETEKPAESGLGFKRTPQRMSIAERLRRFNALAILLRTPRAPPPPPEPLLRDALHETLLEREHRGALQLRRQGARRFGRSISHEGVPRTVAKPNSDRQKGRSVDIQSPEPSVPSAPPEPTTRLEALQLEQELKMYSTPEARPQQENILQVTGNPTRPTQHLEQIWGCQQILRESAPQPEKLDLHSILQMQLNLCDLEQVEGELLMVPLQFDRETQTDTTLHGHLQNLSLVGKDYPVTEVQPQSSTPSTPSSLHLHMDNCSLHFSTATQTDRALPLENYHTTNSEAICSAKDISVFDFIAVDMDGCSLSMDASPPALMFKPPPATRRRYRDSPRWHVHEISMATGDPLQI